MSWVGAGGMIARLGVLLLAFFLVAGTVSAGAESLQENRRELEEIRRRIERANKDLKQHQATERSLSRDLKVVEKALRRSRRRLADYTSRAEKLDADVAAQEKAVAAARDLVRETEGRVRERLVVLYKNGEMGFVRALFDATSPARKAEEYDFLARIVRRDRLLLEDFRKRVSSLEAALAELASLRRQQTALLQEVRAERGNLAETKKMKQSLLKQVRQDEKSLAALIDEMRQRAGRLQALIKRLESDQTPEYTENSGLFASRKGALPWPVQGPVKIGFGPMRHPELGTEFDSQGIEIAVSGSQPVAAVWPGRVIFASRFQGYGNLVIVDHGDNYYTLYAQCSRLEKRVGDRVGQGETVGLSGFDDGERLYFEIRHRGKPLDPSRWLTPR